MAQKYWSTQSLANAYPPWSNVHSDEQSVGFQLLNYGMGKYLDDLNQQLAHLVGNQYLSTSRISDPDKYYSVQLPANFEFTQIDTDNTQLSYSFPSITGHIDSTTYTVSGVNTAKDFWENILPTTITINNTESSINNFLIASGLITQSPFPILETELAFPNKLSISITGATSFYNVLNNTVSPGIVSIFGTTRERISITEDVYFTENETQQTLHNFATVSGINTYNITGDNAFIEVEANNFNNSLYPIAYQYSGSTPEKNYIPMYWEIGASSVLNFSTLKLTKDIYGDIDLKNAGFTDRDTIQEWELLDESYSNITVLDIAPEPNSNRIWAIDASKLYCFDTSLFYPNTKNLLGKNYNAECSIQPSSYYSVRGEEVSLDYTWNRQTKGLVKHRVWVDFPNGTQYSILNGSMITYTSDDNSWVFGEPLDKTIRASDFFTLSQRGDYVFSLEVYYTDDTTTIDKRIISNIYKLPQKSWSLSTIGLTNPVVGIDIDSEYKIWILDNTGTKTELSKFYDIFMVDYKKKVIYTREKYNALVIRAS